MKYTTLIAAGLAAGVSADSWSEVSKPAAETCPKKVTQTVTKSAECAEVTSEVYKTTVTVKESKVKTVTVYADGKTAKNDWEDWKWTPEPDAHSKSAKPSKLPQGCVPEVVTETETAWVKKTGSTVTVTKSTLFVGAAECAKDTVTVTAAGAAPTGQWIGGYPAPGASGDYHEGNNGGYDGGYNGGYNGGDDNGSDGYGHGGDSDNWNDGKGPKYTEAPGGYKVPSSEKVVGTGLWKWTHPAATHTKSYPAPEYTKRPDGSFGYDWGSWDGPGSDGHGKDGPSKGPGKNNGTKPGSGSWNYTAGAPGSNVTKPILPLKGPGLNWAGSREKWCDGKDASSNYYESYFSGRTCKHDITLARATMDVDGTPKQVISINGQYPGPLIECNWGDMIEVTVHNALGNNGTSIHWHGLRQVGTNDADGVPGITECPITPGQSRVYKFHASSYGTSWYHSHWIAQYGDGALGPIIIHGPATADYDEDMGVVQIQDTFNLTADQQNYVIAHTGPKDTENYLLNGMNTKYDLSAGKHTLWSVESGKKYLFRFVNSAAQNMFSVSLDSHTMKVISTDFVPIKPYTTKWLNIAIGQRYDVVIEMDQKVDSYFLRAVTQTGCPSGCRNTGLGNANGIVAYKGVQSQPYLLPTSTTDKTAADFAICDDEPLASLVPYVKMGAGSKSAFSAQASTLPVKAPLSVATNDDGTVFKWFLNNGAININFTQPTLKSLSEKVSLNSTLFSNPIVLHQKNQWVYFVIQNMFFAAHPMHMHGHDFSVLGQGSGLFDPATMTDTLNFDNPARRDTAMLKGASGAPAGPPPTAGKRQAGPPSVPTGYTVIGFETDNPGAWLMHCHIIWHVDGGLALQWIERPDEIETNKYVDGGFKQECKNYAAYENANPGAKKTSGSAGLKRSSPFFDEQVAKIEAFQFDAVRRSDSAAKHYLDTHMKRGFGDGQRRRHIARR